MCFKLLHVCSFCNCGRRGDQRRTTNDDVGYLMLGVFFFFPGNVISLQTSLLCMCCVVLFAVRGCDVVLLSI
jgi:hypothetical protein